MLMEAAGAIFLPAAGYRYGSVVYNVQYGGYYWSADKLGSHEAYSLLCYSNQAGMSYDYRFYGISVRLVKDL
jgi:hypothetical protein